VPGARHLFLGDLAELTRDLPRDMPIALHCQGGTRSAIAASLLQAQGFTRVANVAGGFKAWEAAGLPVERSSRGSTATEGPGLVGDRGATSPDSSLRSE
jgi:hydroxyacylglutathione hydrolase